MTEPDWAKNTLESRLQWTKIQERSVLCRIYGLDTVESHRVHRSAPVTSNPVYSSGLNPIRIWINVNIAGDGRIQTRQSFKLDCEQKNGVQENGVGIALLGVSTEVNGSDKPINADGPGV